MGLISILTIIFNLPDPYPGRHDATTDAGSILKIYSLYLTLVHRVFFVKKERGRHVEKLSKFIFNFSRNKDLDLKIGSPGLCSDTSFLFNLFFGLNF